MDAFARVLKLTFILCAGLLLLGTAIHYYNKLHETPEIPSTLTSGLTTNSALSNVTLPTSTPFYFSQCTSDSLAAQIQNTKLQDKEASCDNQGLCSCPQGKIFNGLRCIPIEGSVWEKPLETLTEKWVELPVGIEFYHKDKIIRRPVAGPSNIRFSQDILKLSDTDLEKLWDSIAPQDSFTMFYASVFRGKKLIDVGSGLARQTMQFAIHGANVTFVDLAPENLLILRRIAKIKSCEDRVHFIQFSTLENLKRDLEDHPITKSGEKFDVITAFGSLHHAPSEMIGQEAAILLEHLALGGRWLQLAYPITRWQNSDGGDNLPLDFEHFGKITDGLRTPWAEWYGPGKLMSLLRKSGSEFVLNWCGKVATDEFIWMELTYLGKNPNLSIREFTNKIQEKD